MSDENITPDESDRNPFGMSDDELDDVLDSSRDPPRARERDRNRVAEVPREPIRFLGEDELDAMPDPEWQVDYLLPLGALATLVAPRESFKSFLLIDVAMSVQTGLPCQGRAVKQGQAIYCFGEGGSGIKRRVRAWKRVNGIDAPTGIRFLAHGLPLLKDGTQRTLIETIEQMLNEGPTLIVIDTLTRFFGGGDQNDTGDMSAFVDACDRVRRAFGCTVLIAHHTPWSDPKRSKGNTALPDSADTELVMERDRDGDRVTLRCGKQKDGPHFAPIALEFFAVAGTDSGVLRPAPVDGAAPSLEMRVLDFVRMNQPCTKRQVRDGVRGPNAQKDGALEALRQRGVLEYSGALGGRVAWHVAGVNPLRHGVGTLPENPGDNPGTARRVDGTGRHGQGTPNGTPPSEGCAAVAVSLETARGTPDPPVVTNLSEGAQPAVDDDDEDDDPQWVKERPRIPNPR